MDSEDFAFGAFILLMIGLFVFSITTISSISNNYENKPCDYFKSFTIKNVPARCYQELTQSK